MNIKSELNKPFMWFKSLTINMILYILVISVCLTTVIVLAGLGWPFKLLFISLTFIGTGIILDGAHDEEYLKLSWRRASLIVILSLIIVEYGLYKNSDYTKTIPVEIVVAYDKNDTKIVKGITFYDMDTSDKSEFIYIREDEQSRVKNLMKVTGHKVYIEYIPFIRYNEKIKYIRNVDS